MVKDSYFAHTHMDTDTLTPSARPQPTLDTRTTIPELPQVPTVPARLTCKHAPHRAGRAAPRTHGPSDQCLSGPHPHTINPSAGSGDTCSSSVSSCAQKRPAAPRRASPLGVLDLRMSPSCRPSPPASARCAVGRPSAPAAAAPPHHAPAAAVERLGKARRRAPFVYSATVQGRVSGRIGPLVLGSRRCGQAAEQEPGP